MNCSTAVVSFFAGIKTTLLGHPVLRQGPLFLALLDSYQQRSWYGVFVCRPSVRVAIICELNAWISFKF